jgi:uncharacterized protein (TIGR02996 family)
VTTDAAALLAMIRAHPDDDAPRLVYADWLDEKAGERDCGSCLGSGHFPMKGGRVHYDRCLSCKGSGRISNSYAERAEFIRVQVELARLDPPPITVTERCVLSSENRLGPNYYSLTGGEGTEDGGRLIFGAKVGGRVDVLKPRDRKPLYGLRIHKIEDDAIIVVKDAKSGPWPGEALRDRERELWRRCFLDWLPRITPGGWSHCKQDVCVADWGGVTYRFRRGFPAEARLTTAALMGGPCGRDVDGVFVHAPGPCPTCHGSGHIPGLAAAIGRLGTMERVVLMDCKAWRSVVDRSKYIWFRATGDDDYLGLGRLPEELFDMVQCHPDERDKDIVRNNTRTFPSEAIAIDALAVAAAKYCRQEIGRG